MGLFTSSSAEVILGRIAAALEALLELKRLEMASRGLTFATGDLEGEILDTSEELISAKEREEERKLIYGLAPDRDYSPTDPEGRPWPASGPSTSVLFPSASYAWTGPEGAEEPLTASKEAGRA
jgi:hypothetical protein